MTMQRHPVRKPFNLVEITLAMGVIAMGIAGVMALMQLGMQQSRDAIGDNYAADAAEQFITYLSILAADGANWDNDGLNITGFSVASNKGTAKTGTEGNVQLPNVNIIPGTDGMYRFIQGARNSSDPTLVDETRLDFDAVVLVWQDQIMDVYFGQDASGNDVTSDIPKKYGVSVNIEIGWPRGMPYDRRNKRLFYFEIFNRNVTP